MLMTYWGERYTQEIVEHEKIKEKNQTKEGDKDAGDATSVLE